MKLIVGIRTSMATGGRRRELVEFGFLILLQVLTSNTSEVYSFQYLHR